MCLHFCDLSTCRSTTLDSWNQEQLKTMAYGGNGRARVFFKQHGWTDGGKIEQKYTSRAADLYRQLLAKEVIRSTAAAPSTAPFLGAIASAEISSSAGEAVNAQAAKEDAPIEQTPSQMPEVPKAVSPRVSAVTRKGPAVTRRLAGAKPGGGLGVKKLSAKVRKCCLPGWSRKALQHSPVLMKGEKQFKYHLVRGK
jgi:ADP-ribosylation factor GTPase-activating protein 2/3